MVLSTSDMVRNDRPHFSTGNHSTGNHSTKHDGHEGDGHSSMYLGVDKKNRLESRISSVAQKCAWLYNIRTKPVETLEQLMYGLPDPMRKMDSAADIDRLRKAVIENDWEYAKQMVYAHAL
jgi:hypothetical protein